MVTSCAHTVFTSPTTDDSNGSDDADDSDDFDTLMNLTTLTTLTTLMTPSFKGRCPLKQNETVIEFRLVNQIGSNVLHQPLGGR